MEKLSYKIEAFEGPLDLLLYLISKNKLNIFDIQISELLEQYLQQIDVMKERDMDVSSEFLEMAARLVHIKSVSLLPKHEEAEELKRELTGQLLEYQDCKKVAQRLQEQISFQTFVREAMEVELDQTYKRRHCPDEILQAYLNAAGRGKRFQPPPAESFSGIVSRRVVSVASRIIFVLRKLWIKKEIPYDTLFTTKQGRSEMVATFLALLELVKGKRVRIENHAEQETVKLVDGGGKHWRSKRFQGQ